MLPSQPAPPAQHSALVPFCPPASSSPATISPFRWISRKADEARVRITARTEPEGTSRWTRRAGAPSTSMANTTGAPPAPAHARNTSSNSLLGRQLAAAPARRSRAQESRAGRSKVAVCPSMAMLAPDLGYNFIIISFPIGKKFRFPLLPRRRPLPPHNRGRSPRARTGDARRRDAVRLARAASRQPRPRPLFLAPDDAPLAQGHAIRTWRPSRWSRPALGAARSTWAMGGVRTGMAVRARAGRSPALNSMGSRTSCTQHPVAALPPRRLTTALLVFVPWSRSFFAELASSLLAEQRARKPLISTAVFDSRARAWSCGRAALARSRCLPLAQLRHGRRPASCVAQYLRAQRHEFIIS